MSSQSQTRPSNPSRQSQAYTAPADAPPAYDARPLPAGWVEQLDPRTGRKFFVDTLAVPPRSIWVHPLDDPDFIRSHRKKPEPGPVDSDDDSDHSHTPSTGYPRDEKKSRPDDDRLRVPSADRGEASSRPSSPAKGKSPGFFQKIFGTEEERAAKRARRAARQAEREAQREREAAEYRRQEREYYERRDALLAERMEQIKKEREACERAGVPYRQYGAPQMYDYGGPTYQNPSAYGQSPYGQQRSGGSVMPLLGGLAGGLLLGDLLF